MVDEDSTEWSPRNVQFVVALGMWRANAGTRGEGRVERWKESRKPSMRERRWSFMCRRTEGPGGVDVSKGEPVEKVGREGSEGGERLPRCKSVCVCVSDPEQDLGGPPTGRRKESKKGSPP